MMMTGWQSQMGMPPQQGANVRGTMLQYPGGMGPGVRYGIDVQNPMQASPHGMEMMPSVAGGHPTDGSVKYGALSMQSPSGLQQQGGSGVGTLQQHHQEVLGMSQMGGVDSGLSASGGGHPPIVDRTDDQFEDLLGISTIDYYLPFE